MRASNFDIHWKRRMMNKFTGYFPAVKEFSSGFAVRFRKRNEIRNTFLGKNFINFNNFKV